MIGVNALITAINSLISGGSLNDLQVSELSAALLNVEQRGVSSVSDFNHLPAAGANTGRFFWIENEQRYVFSNGVDWNIDGIFLPPVNLYSWGSNLYGSLGDNTTVNKSSPVSVTGGFSDWTDISAGRLHSLALKANGSAWSWGNSFGGQLGDNTTTNRSSPVAVMGQFSDWMDVSAGRFHSLAVRASGSAWAWGGNATGQLGDNTATNRSSPVSVVGGFSDWTSVSAGGSHSLGVRASGSAWAWGYNGYGALGDNTATNRSSPVSVVGGFSDWTTISVGEAHSLAIRANGTSWSWGYNVSGGLGDNTTVNKSSPMSVVGGFSDWTSVSGGGYHSLALRANGTTWSWGDNGSGQLGDNTTVNKSSPMSVVGGFSDWTSVSAGGNHSLALRASGSAWAWGNNAQGRLGDNSTVSKSSPVSVVGGFSDWTSASAGGFHTLGLRA